MNAKTDAFAAMVADAKACNEAARQLGWIGAVNSNKSARRTEFMWSVLEILAIAEEPRPALTALEVWTALGGVKDLSNVHKALIKFVECKEATRARVPNGPRKYTYFITDVGRAKLAERESNQ